MNPPCFPVKTDIFDANISYQDGYPRSYYQPYNEFTNSGGAALASEVDALSADHLMAVSDEGISKLSKSNVVATLLPGTTFFLGKNTFAPARKLLLSRLGQFLTARDTDWFELMSRGQPAA